MTRSLDTERIIEMKPKVDEKPLKVRREVIIEKPKTREQNQYRNFPKFLLTRWEK